MSCLLREGGVAHLPKLVRGALDAAALRLHVLANRSVGHDKSRQIRRSGYRGYKSRVEGIPHIGREAHTICCFVTTWRPSEQVLILGAYLRLERR
jgi:hypothetical protein